MTTRIYRWVALTFIVALTACGGGGSSGGSVNVTPVTNEPSAIAGLWEAQTARLNNQSEPVPSGAFYLFFADVTATSLLISTYSLSDFANCLDENTGPLIQVGENQYQNAAGTIATITVTSNNTLEFSVPDEDGDIAAFDLDREVGLSVDDLSVCPTSGNRSKPEFMSTFKKFVDGLI